MIELIRCPRESCGRVQFEIDSECFTGGVIIRCHRCKSYLRIDGARSIQVLKDYASPNVVTININRPATPASNRHS